MSDEITEQAPATESQPPAEPATDDLGDAGKRALDAERKARRAAEKAAADALAKVQAFEDAQKSEGEKLAARLKAAEDRAAKAESDAARAQIVNELGIPADVAADIAGSTPEEFRAAAERIKAHLAPAQKFGPVDTSPKSVADSGLPKQLTRTDIASMSPAQIEAARVAGQLDTLMGVKH